MNLPPRSLQERIRILARSAKNVVSGNRQAAGSISVLWMGSLAGGGCAFLTQVLLARGLGPVDFGTFAAALGMVTLIAPLATFGLGPLWLRIFGQEGWPALRWLGVSLRYAMGTTVAVLAALALWAVLGPHDATTRGLLLALSSFVLGQAAVELVSSKLQLEARYESLALWQFLPHLTRLALVAGLTFAAIDLMTLKGVVLAYLATSLTVFALGVPHLWRMHRGALDLKSHGAEPTLTTEKQPVTLRQIAAQAWPFGLAGVAHLVYFQSDIILLKYIQGSEASGIYNVAFVIMTAVYIFPGVVYQKFLMPKIHRWSVHDRSKFRRVYRYGNWVMLALGLCAMTAIWILGPMSVRILFGAGYAAAISALSILALAVPIRFVATSVGSSLVTQNHMKTKVKLMTATAVLNVAFNAALIPLYGITGAAVSTVLCEAILLALYANAARRYVFANT